MDEKNELQNRKLHISGRWGTEKVDIQDKKVDIEDAFSGKTQNFSVKTVVHIHRLFDKFGYDGIFGRSAVVELLELQNSRKTIKVNSISLAYIFTSWHNISKKFLLERGISK